MSTDHSTDAVIASVLQLPIEQRLIVMDAIHVSLTEASPERVPLDLADEVAEAWKSELTERIAELAGGNIQAISADEAERLIRADA